MSNLIKMFKASSNEIIQKYSTLLADYYMKCRKDISKEKSALGFDKQLWSVFTINMLCFVLSPMDFYLYLACIGFIVNIDSSKCEKCSGKLVVNFKYLFRIVIW